MYDYVMAQTTELISVEDYLATNYKPSCEYVDGVLYPKAMGTYKHGTIQAQIAQLINVAFREFRAATELTVRLREDKYLIPDVGVQQRDRIQDPYPTEPIYLCVEILSPNDRMSGTFAKAEAYQAWGVQTVWIVDPEERRGWVYRSGHRPVEVPVDGSLTAGEISISCDDIFSVLD